MKLYLATKDGLVSAGQQDGDLRVDSEVLTGQEMTTVVADNALVVAGSTDGIYRSQDGGERWQEASEGLQVRHVRWLGQHPQRPDFLAAGTEPAAIFISDDEGRSWRECSEVAAMRDRYDWMLPYSPAAGCIRGFAFNGARAYAAAEDGAALRSDDGGESWKLAPGSAGERLHSPSGGSIHSDVHSIHVHPSSPDLVMAPTGGGLFFSKDGGQSWTNLYRCYCRALWWDAEDPQHLIFGPADGVDRNGRLEESYDGGQQWRPLDEGLDTPWRQHMVERLQQIDDELYAVLSNGQLIVAPLAGGPWRAILAGAGWVNDIAAGS